MSKHPHGDSNPGPLAEKQTYRRAAFRPKPLAIPNFSTDGSKYKSLHRALKGSIVRGYFGP